MNKQRCFSSIIIALLSSFLIGNCTSSAPLFDTATPTIIAATSTATAGVLPPSETPVPPTLVSPTVVAIQTTVDPALHWCDSFDDGVIDQSRWNLPTDSDIIYEKNGVLNFRVIEEQSSNSGAWAGLEAMQTAQPISEISYTITLESYGEDTPGGVGLDTFLIAEDPLFSFDIGPGPNGPGGEYSFCPDMNAEYDACEHPTPIPDKASLQVVVGTPLQVRVVGTGKDVGFYVDNVFRAGQSVTAFIENFQFFVYADEGSILHAVIDNVCVMYKSN